MAHREMLCVAGDWLHCSEGHQAFRARRDIRLGEVVWSHDLERPCGERPRQNEIATCPTCGGFVQLAPAAKAA